MNSNVQHAARLDSKCSRRLIASDTPDAVAPRCKADATTWVVSSRGTRRYVCEDHAREVLRFRDDTDADDDALPEHPTVRPCSVCGKYTLRGDMDLPTGTCGDCLPAEDVTTDVGDADADADVGEGEGGTEDADDEGSG